MHNFDELVYRGTAFTLSALEELNSKVIEEPETSASSIAVKNLQMIQLQKGILAIGMFSLFESLLQQGLSCRNGFKEAKKVILQNGKVELLNRFDNFICAINVLKHGRGRSYDTLISKSELLAFKIKLPDDNFFNEGDVSEVSTLIKVDDEFVLNCAELIKQISNEIRNEFSDYFL
jgi:hypothetical protein